MTFWQIIKHIRAIEAEAREFNVPCYFTVLASYAGVGIYSNLSGPDSLKEIAAYNDIYNEPKPRTLVQYIL